MFNIKAESELQKQLNNPQDYYPPEVCVEINQFVEILRRDGQFSKTDFFDLNTNKISGLTCNLFYRPDFAKEEVLIIAVKVKPADVFRQRFNIRDEWDDKDVIESIPQYDQPEKIVRAIELIHQGVQDSYELGYKLEHRGKKKEYISRHGQYAKHTLEQLKLITRTRKGKKWIVELTEKGRRIAEGINDDLKLRLLYEAMLHYPPVWRIIVAVSEIDSQLNEDFILNDDLIKNLVFPEILRGADTSNRRSQTLKNWIKSISIFFGMPIRLHNHGMQLTIPMLYAENEYNNENTEED
ncbi:hypothetical protein PN488_11975 [Nodularia spumigena CS-591/12]|uniref:DUF7226 domain-containing protein n=1 Tax=Nodularia spumigena TaxID=70799 RepID=UPI00232A82F8|nr:hypothetical protein [Nodularia spumigena]MDB9305087.1 hypothetical protein [Nodularia spumigena CS-591/12]MDB9342602.1 hypothetical protein [Nodularia spumigena CS-588/06]MDB9367981.1 hypothetical protein [Nodularia spumigena CS-586/05]